MEVSLKLPKQLWPKGVKTLELKVCPVMSGTWIYTARSWSLVSSGVGLEHVNVRLERILKHRSLPLLLCFLAKSWAFPLVSRDLFRTMFRWIVHVKRATWKPGPIRILHCNEMIRIIHWICQDNHCTLNSWDDYLKSALQLQKTFSWFYSFNSYIVICQMQRDDNFVNYILIFLSLFNRKLKHLWM